MFDFPSSLLEFIHQVSHLLHSNVVMWRALYGVCVSVSSPILQSATPHLPFPQGKLWSCDDTTIFRLICTVFKWKMPM